ncbi:hypothetical protein R3P38DRAFT_3266781 [Favolaschia claudopus]|uniref:Uncharacterized protein n=1 Tax=Favolaschia claudopus TaxID=2862362 RepID=A0AAW0BUF2_9AGAR
MHHSRRCVHFPQCTSLDYLQPKLWEVSTVSGLRFRLCDSQAIPSQRSVASGVLAIPCINSAVFSTHIDISVASSLPYDLVLGRDGLQFCRDSVEEACFVLSSGTVDFRRSSLSTAPSLPDLQGVPHSAQIIANDDLTSENYRVDSRVSSDTPHPSTAFTSNDPLNNTPVLPSKIIHDIFLGHHSTFLLSLSIQTNLSEFLSILRLSHKYDVPFLRRLTLSQLESLFPTTLSQYDARAPSTSGVNKSPTPSSLPTLFSVVQTLTEVNAPWLLPVLYYDICRLDLDKIVSSSAWLTLSDAQRRPFLLGSQNQARQMFNVIELSFLAKGQYDPQCKDWKTCNKNRLQLAHAMSRRTLPLVLTSPLDVWSPVFWEAVETAQDPLCKPCVTEARKLHALARQAFWNGLPGLYDLADWHELEELRKAAFPLS